MPYKDKEKAKEAKKIWARNNRQKLKELKRVEPLVVEPKPVEPVEPKKNVEPSPKVEPKLFVEPVEPKVNVNNVEPLNEVETLEIKEEINRPLLYFWVDENKFATRIEVIKKNLSAEEALQLQIQSYNKDEKMKELQKQLVHFQQIINELQSKNNPPIQNITKLENTSKTQGNINAKQLISPKSNLVNNCPPKKNEKLIKEIEEHNKLVYQRAGTQEEKRFYTFLDGRKIVRTKCGCNPQDDFYDWCLDNCAYFTSWREQQITYPF